LNRKTLSAVLALTVVLVVSGNALAAPSGVPESLNQIKDKRQQLEMKVEKLDNQIVSVMKQIDNNKKDIQKISENLKQNQIQLETSQKGIKDKQALFNKRIRAMYINGVNSYVDVLLQSNSLGDLISRADTVSKIIGFDKKVVNDLKYNKEIISKKRRSLDEQNNKVIAIKSDNDKKLSKLDSDKQEQIKLIVDLKDKERVLAVADTATTKLVAVAKNKVQQVRAAAPKISRGTSSVASVPASSDSIVAYASNFLGTPYQWGGNGPSTFDCSGFTSYVYTHFGVSLPRVSSDQQNTGTAISRDQLQPGDLVFFGYPAHHVGIYVGNGCYIHAPSTGDVVKVSPVDRPDYSGARRVN